MQGGVAERLGEWCVRTGLATREEIEDCLRIQSATRGARLADILVSRGMLTHRQVGQALAAQDTPGRAQPSPEPAQTPGTPPLKRRRGIVAGVSLTTLLAVAGLLSTEAGAPDPAAAFAEREAQVWRRLAGLEAEEAERDAGRLLALCHDGPLKDRAARLADETRWVARVLRRAHGPRTAAAPLDPMARLTHLERALRVPDDRDLLGLAILSLRSGLPGSESRFRDLLQTSLAPVAERYLLSFGSR